MPAAYWLAKSTVVRPQSMYEQYEPVNARRSVDHSRLAAMAPRRAAKHASRAPPSSPTMHALVNSQPGA